MKWKKPYSPRLVDKDRWILSHCGGKRVAHLGCTAAPLTEKRMRQGKLLHLKIDSVCEHVLGIDIDAASVEQIAPRCRNSSFLVCDACRPPPGLFEETWDVIVVGDILEHVGNPVALLEACSALAEDDGIVLATAPNALSFRGVLSSLRGAEKVHDDHVAYYSPWTLSELGRRSGLAPVEIVAYNGADRRPLRRTILGILRRLRPIGSDGIGIAFRSMR